MIHLLTGPVSRYLVRFGICAEPTHELRNVRLLYTLDNHRLKHNRLMGLVLRVACHLRDLHHDVLAFDYLAKDRMMAVQPGVGAAVIKNWLPLVLGPGLAMANVPGLSKT